MHRTGTAGEVNAVENGKEKMENGTTGFDPTIFHFLFSIFHPKIENDAP